MLSRRERLRVAWELVWRGALLDACLGLTLYLIEVGAGSALAVQAVAVLFAIMPWVVRRAVSLSYPGWRFGIADEEGGEPRALTYQESLKVVWLLAWRSTLLLLAALPLLSLAVRALRLPLVEWARAASRAGLDSLGLTVLDFVTGLLFFPWLIPGMIRKRYRGFRLSVERPQPKRAAPVRVKKKRR